MASGDQLIALLNAHYSNNEMKFRTIALQIAADEAKKGHNVIAEKIKDIVDKDPNKLIKLFEVNKINTQNMSPFFDISYPDMTIKDLVVSEFTLTQIDKIIKEFKNKNKLLQYGLINRRKILLFGPPGTGKTMTSRIIASELSIPLFTLRLDQVLTKFLGETSKKLREIFEYISGNMGVFLFDEFDAIGTNRSLDNEVGEMRRILNSFLVLLENDTSRGIIICATNNPDLLDNALFRRFDEVIKYENPNEKEIKKLYSLIFRNFNINYIPSKELLKNNVGISHAEILNICNEAIKDYVINGNELNDKKLNEIIMKRKYLYNFTTKEA